MNGLLAGAGAALGSAGAAAACWVVFRRLLPAERELARQTALSERRAAFALELLKSRRAPSSPGALAEAVQSAADAFLGRFGGVSLFVWACRSAVGVHAASDGELAVRSGALEALAPGDLEVPPELWDGAFSTGAVQPWGGASLGGPATLRPWGSRGKVWGLLGAVQTAPGGDFLRVHEPALAELAAYLDTLAERAAQLWELEKDRLELEGGLDVTMRRLDETNLQLIRRAREVRTFQEVTDAITHRPDGGVLEAIVSIVARALEADLCAFLLLDDETGELVTQPGAFGIANDEGALYRIALSNEESSSVRVFKTGEPFLTSDAQTDPAVIARYARLWRCHSLLVVPLVLEGRRIGVLRVGSFKKAFFTPEHAQFVSLIAEEAAVLVESAVLSKKLAATNKRLAEMHRMKDDFVSTVSHEFKTPLTSILGFLAVLLDGDAGPLADEQRRFLGIVRSAAQRLSELVSDILDISKLETGVEMEVEPVDLGAAARRAVDETRWRAEEKNLSFEADLPAGLPRALGSERWLGQVFENLISNAIKFSLPGGRVKVSLSHKGEGLQASVEDCGVGIPEADQGRIFEKFFRASNREATGASGTGLGLAICRRIIDRHSGRIWFESSAGKGTKFHFVVPVARAVGAAEDRPKDAHVAPEGR